MEPKSSEDPATGTYPETDESSPHLPILFPKNNNNIIFPSMPRFSEFSSLQILLFLVCI
jgi:hypothetical protein